MYIIFESRSDAWRPQSGAVVDDTLTPNMQTLRSQPTTASGRQVVSLGTVGDRTDRLVPACLGGI